MVLFKEKLVEIQILLSDKGYYYIRYSLLYFKEPKGILKDNAGQMLGFLESLNKEIFCIIEQFTGHPILDIQIYSS
jgi:hypothetical protein